MFCISYIPCACTRQQDTAAIEVSNKESQEKIIQQYLIDSAQQYSYYSKAWQYYIDKGLEQDSTIAYLWQQKAMPLFKQGKYEAGMKFLDKAVYYDKTKWLSYRAFIKCIFAKTYEAAITDFEACIQMEGNSYVMDHSYRFYIALSKIQLDQFEEAEKILSEEIQRVHKEQGADWVHHLVLFYQGIALYEQARYEQAIATFDKALAIYPRFSDVQYYKAMSLLYLDKADEAHAMLKIGKENAEAGYTINEDNEIYERYPYQVRLYEYGD